MTAIEIAQILATIILTTVGNGLLGNWLLKAYEARQEAKLVEVKNAFDADLRRLQTQLDRTLLVHRAQFEVEFEALRDVWAKASRLRSAVAGLRPIGGVVPVNDTIEAKKARLLERGKTLFEAHDAAMAAIDDRSPFYSADIQTDLAELLRISREAILDIQIEEPFTSEWFKRGEAQTSMFNSTMESLSGLIRHRLNALSVYPSE